MDFFHYKFRMITETTCAFYDLFTGQFVANFEAPLSSNKHQKLYVVTQGNDFLYVGATSSSIKLRLNQGFKANGKGGYHGYKWKHNRDEMEMHIVCFPKDNNSKLEVEAIEAELVFLIRQRTGNWPLYQNEIHFNNTNPKAIELASQIYEHILNPSPQSHLSH